MLKFSNLYSLISRILLYPIELAIIELHKHIQLEVPLVSCWIIIIINDNSFHKLAHTCRSLVKGDVYIPPEETVITLASGAAFSNNGNINSVVAKVPNTFMAKFSSNL